MRKQVWLVAAVAVVAGASALWIAGVGPGDRVEKRLSPGDPAIVAQGQAVYAAQCAACHGADLEGQPNWRQRNADGRLPAPPHDVSGHTWHHADALLFDMTKYGIAAIAGGDYQSDMPAYDGVLTDAEIIAVLSFIKSTWPPEVQVRQSSLNPE